MSHMVLCPGQRTCALVGAGAAGAGAQLLARSGRHVRVLEAVGLVEARRREEVQQAGLRTSRQAGGRDGLLAREERLGSKWCRQSGTVSVRSVASQATFHMLGQ